MIMDGSFIRLFQCPLNNAKNKQLYKLRHEKGTDSFNTCSELCSSNKFKHNSTNTIYQVNWLSIKIGLDFNCVKFRKKCEFNPVKMEASFEYSMHQPHILNDRKYRHFIWYPLPILLYFWIFLLRLHIHQFRPIILYYGSMNTKEYVLTYGCGIK